MTVNRRNYLIVWAILLSAGLAWSVLYWNFIPHLPDTYSGEAVYGKVVDAVSGKPVAGAIVIGINELRAPYGLEGHIIAGNMHIEEVVTDAEGHYRLPAWGPKPRVGKTYLDHEGPKLLVYKNGYELYTYISFFEGDRFSPVQTSYLNDKTLELKRFQGDLEAYTLNLSQVAVMLDSVLDPVFGAGNCGWLATPRIILELDRLKQAAEERGINTSRIPALEPLLADGNCGNREDIIRRYANDITDDIQDSDSIDN